MLAILNSICFYFKAPSIQIYFILLLFTATGKIVTGQSIQNEHSSEIEERAEFEWERIRNPYTQQIPVNAYWQALLETKQASEFYSQTAARTSALSWTERGPDSDIPGSSNGNTRANNGITAGRIRAIWVDLADATGKTVWVGGVDGGIWKSNDITTAPANWILVNDYLSNLAVSDICQDPANTNIMYFCTGESYFNADAVAGAGVFKSSDHGVTWSQLSSTSLYTYCTRILCDASGNIYLATRGNGLLRSTDGGATWGTITPSGMGNNICDLELSSTGRMHVVAGIFSTQSYRYTNSPASVTSSSGWNAPVTPFPSYAMRAEIACSGNTLYACPADANYEVPTIYKSTDGGMNWTATSGQPSSGWASSQGWYSLAIGIDPSNTNTCIVGGLNNYKTTNGGSTWTKISNWVGTTGQYVHADIHDIVWYDNGNKLLFACDGGVHFSSNKGTTIRDRNAGLRIKQFYSVAIHPTATHYFLAGAQDNGTHQFTLAGLGSTVEVTGGDGGFVAIDQNQPQYQFASYVYNQYRRSTDGGNTWSSVNLSSTAGQFINPFDYDHINNKLYAAHNAGNFLRWDNPQTGNTNSIVAISAFNGYKVSAVKVSPFTNHKVFFGTSGGRIVRCDNANTGAPTASNITGSSMPAAYVSCINTGTSDQFLIACYSNYGVNNVWYSINQGATWTAIDGNLPDMPVRWCMFEPNDNTRGIIATETGVWETTLFNGNATVWYPSLNFPVVRTDMLQYRSSDSLLAAATHGRGLFTTIVSEANTCNSPGNLYANSITPTSAVLHWNTVVGAIGYIIEYRPLGGINWTTLASNWTGDSILLSGLNASTTYEWQVSTQCVGGNSLYTGSSFTTLILPSCAPPTALVATSVTTTDATLSWASVVGAFSYDVDYKISSSSSWINAASGITSNSVQLNSLSSSSTYDWQVRANCSSGSSAYSYDQFATASANTCPGSFDIFPNGTPAGAPVIPFNTDIYGKVWPPGDMDYYQFVITNPGTATITLQNLPSNYDLILYNQTGTTVLAASRNPGTLAESISAQFSAGTYYVRVAGAYSSAAQQSACYILQVQLGTASLQEPLISMNNQMRVFILYPNPAKDILQISTSKTDFSQYNYIVRDLTGRVCLQGSLNINPTRVPLTGLIPGMYLIEFCNDWERITYSFIKKTE